MSSLQKTIKYMAIGFAIVLAITIISGIASTVFSIGSVISGGTNDKSNNETIDYSDSFKNVKSLEVDNNTGRLIIKTGETFRVEASDVSSSFEAKVTSDGTLKITDNTNVINFLWFNINGVNKPNSKITVYLPAETKLEEADINTGAGTVNVEDLNAEYLKISTGAGNISGNNLTADKVKVEGGVGEINLQNVEFYNADFDCGVGSLKVDGVMEGKIEVDCGVGEVNLNLKGSVEDYDLDIDSGVGAVRLNNEKISDEYRTSKDAPNSIRVDGGVGEVRINIEN
ncbi:MAG: DUF4097 family beta strand repeat-containing protein [Mobilitalea sp.]